MDNIEDTNEYKKEDDYPEEDDDISPDDNDVSPDDEGFKTGYDGEDFGFDDFLDDLEWDYKENENLLNFFLERKNLKEKFDFALKDLKLEKDDEKRGKLFSKYKTLLIENVKEESLNDELNSEAWDGFVIKEEKEKFIWEQKVKNLNQALEEQYIKLDYKNRELYNFLKNNVEESVSEKKREINGYFFRNKKIIQRNKQGNFYLLQNRDAQKFIDTIKKYTTTSARSELTDILGTDSNIEVTARECLNELRFYEESLISRTSKYIELQEIRNDIFDAEDATDNLKNNRKTKIKNSIIMRTMEGRLNELRTWVKDNKTTLGVAGSSLLLSLISGVATTIPLLEKLKSGVKTVKRIGNIVEKAGKKIHKLGTQLDSILSEPTKTAGAIVDLLGRFITEVSSLPYIGLFLSFLLIASIILHIIKRWRGEY